VDSWRPHQADVLFLGSLDWRMLTGEQRRTPAIPIINLIQHVRHGHPLDPRSVFLTYKAIRICITEEVKEAILKTRRVNGPVVVIPIGLDWEGVPRPRSQAERDVDLVIAGLKQPLLALRLARRLARRGRRIKTLLTLRPRADYLDWINRARVAVFLPNPTEGFYLPPLEAMALGTVAVYPDYKSNRAFGRSGVDHFRPRYALGEIAEAAEAALALSPSQAAATSDAAQQTASRYTLQHEREAFLHVLNDVDRLWRSG
jgi:glycosyltransferase involved in cell wall biosynthesis